MHGQAPRARLQDGGGMTLDQALAMIAALEAQIDEQARNFTRVNLAKSREVKRREAAERCAAYWERMAKAKASDRRPKWVADIIRDVETMFGKGE